MPVLGQVKVNEQKKGHPLATQAPGDTINRWHPEDLGRWLLPATRTPGVCLLLGGYFKPPLIFFLLFFFLCEGNDNGGAT